MDKRILTNAFREISTEQIHFASQMPGVPDRERDEMLREILRRMHPHIMRQAWILSSTPNRRWGIDIVDALYSGGSSGFLEGLETYEPLFENPIESHLKWH